jgi:hypothetical protein
MSSRKDAAPVGDSRYLFHRRDTKCTASFLAIIELVNVKTLKLPARIIAVSFRPVMPRRVAPQQSPLPLRRLAYCLDEAGTMPRRPTCNQFPGLTDGVQSRESESLISWMGDPAVRQPSSSTSALVPQSDGCIAFTTIRCLSRCRAEGVFRRWRSTRTESPL